MNSLARAIISILPARRECAATGLEGSISRQIGHGRGAKAIPKSESVRGACLDAVLTRRKFGANLAFLVSSTTDVPALNQPVLNQTSQTFDRLLKFSHEIHEVMRESE